MNLTPPDVDILMCSHSWSEEFPREKWNWDVLGGLSPESTWSSPSTKLEWMDECFLRGTSSKTRRVRWWVSWLACTALVLLDCILMFWDFLVLWCRTWRRRGTLNSPLTAQRLAKCTAWTSTFRKSLTSLATKPLNCSNLGEKSKWLPRF